MRSAWAGFPPLLILSAVMLFCASGWGRPPDMVQIEVEIFEVFHEAGQDLGFSWDFVNTNPAGDLKSSFSRFPVGLNQKGQLTLEVLDMRFGVLTTSIEAAMHRGHAKLLSRPTLVTLDGRPASISSGEEVPFFELAKEVGKQAYKTQFRQTGVSLNVTPSVVHSASRDDRIHLTVNTSVSEISRFERFENSRGSWELPVISRRNASTPLLVNDHSTIVMGGLLEQRHRTTERGVPFLSSLPLLGFAFRSKSEKDMESEVILFITPTILRPGLVTTERRVERITKATNRVAATADGTKGTGQPNQLAAAPPQPPQSSAPPRMEDGIKVVKLHHDFLLKENDLEGDQTELMITGYLHNANDETIKKTELEITIYDRFGAIYDTKTVKVGKLRPDQQRPFKVRFKQFDGHMVSAFNVERIEILPYLN